MRIQSFRIHLGLLCALLLSACATYYVTPESLRSQLRTAVPVEGTFYLAGGLFNFRKMEFNGIRELVVTDKEGNEKRLKVTLRTGIRIHKKDGDYSTFYFDTLFIHDNAVVGQRTHFFPSGIKPIRFDEITRIELQR